VANVAGFVGWVVRVLFFFFFLFFSCLHGVSNLRPRFLRALCCATCAAVMWGMLFANDNLVLVFLSGAGECEGVVDRDAALWKGQEGQAREQGTRRVGGWVGG
jgi:hypothetical protein